MDRGIKILAFSIILALAIHYLPLAFKYFSSVDSSPLFRAMMKASTFSPAK